MKIKYLLSRAGKGFIINPGDEATVSTEKGQRLIGLGVAEEVKGKPTRKAPEVVTTEVKKATRKRKKK